MKDPTAVSWRANWLKDSLFRDVPYRELRHPERCEANNGLIRNVHTLFRRAFSLAGKPVAAARLSITADDCYKLYVNGEFVGVGPAPAYPFAQPYNQWDIASLLRPGAINCIAAHVYYQGLHSQAFVSADNLQGLLAQLEIRFADGSAEVIATDGQWRCWRSGAYSGTPSYGYQTQFTENIDLRLWEPRWDLPDFDDSQWETPVVCPDIPPQYTLVPQSTPPVSYERVRPLKVVCKAPGRYFIDFGTELVGESSFTVTGPAGHRVEIRHGEELSGPDEVRYDIRANCCYQEFATLSGRPGEKLEFYDYKGFRYIEVLNWPEELVAANVSVMSRHYPFDETACEFNSSVPLLNDIWALCANGVKRGTLDTYLDCPTREKGGYVGDAFVTGQSHLLLSGDARILRKFLQDVAHSARLVPGLLAVTPTNCTGHLAEYSFLVPELLERYYAWSGDLEFARGLVPVLGGMLDYYRKFENADGLLQDVITDSCTVLIDWPPNLRDGYDDPACLGAELADVAGKGPLINTVANAFYYGSLVTTARLSVALGLPQRAEEFLSRAGRVKDAMMHQLRDSATGLFIDRVGSSHSALQASVAALYAGLIPPADIPAVVQFIRRKRLSCGVYFAYFVLKSLCRLGQASLAYDLITSHDERSWHTMLAAGATTCMEAWGPEQKWNTSWCHPWSSAPIPIMASEILGLSPAMPGWEAVRFSPRLPSTLQHTAIKISTPLGPVSLTAGRSGNGWEFHLAVPPGCTSLCDFSGTPSVILIDGLIMQSKKPERDLLGVTRTYLPEALAPGEHKIQVAYAEGSTIET